MSRCVTGRLVWLGVVVPGLALSVTLAAQTKIPKRPELPAGADSNDAYSYSRLGFASLRNDPDVAADAYFWAARLNPIWAEAYYGRRTALLLQDPRQLVRYFRGDRSVIRSKEMLAIDSLYLHALNLDPFLGAQLDQLLIEAVVREISNQATRGSSVSPGEVAYRLQIFLAQGPPALRAGMAYRGGEYDEALRLYAKAISDSRHKGPLLAERGRLLYQIGRRDSALVDLTRAVEEMRKEDKKDLVFLYESKAILEQRIGMIHHVAGNEAAAKEAFGRALQEDLSYFPAHVQLAYLGLEKGDTATANSEMDLAVQLRPQDAGLRFQYGFILGSMSKLQPAEEQLRKAIELDPPFAAPHYVLGQVLQALGNRQGAIQEYQTFLSMSSRHDPRRDEAVQTIEILKAAGSAAK